MEANEAYDPNSMKTVRVGPKTELEKRLDAARHEPQTDEEFAELSMAERAKQLPRPTGYKLLIALIEPDEKTEGGILKADETKRMEEVGSIVGYVVAVGPDAYADRKRFPNGKYCEQGDTVMFRAYSGTRFMIHGTEWRLLNDDSIEAVVDDPRGITKIL
jgi:co-chaperonin GroES (HSP10)